MHNFKNLEDLSGSLDGLKGLAKGLGKVSESAFDFMTPEMQAMMTDEDRKLINEAKNAFNFKGDLTAKSEQLLKTLKNHGK